MLLTIFQHYIYETFKCSSSLLFAKIIDNLQVAVSSD